jgi:hypothetical protein
MAQETPPGQAVPGRHGNGETETRENSMRNPTLVEGDRHQSPIPVVLDNAGRVRQRVLALFLPVAAALYISAEAVNPRGTDQPITSRATALRELPIAAHHPTQLFVSGSLTFLALGALAGGPVLRRPGTRPAAGINRPAPRHRAHAPLCGGNGPAGRPDLAGSSAAGQPQPGAGRRAREHPVKMSRHSPDVSQILRFLESVKARA